MKMENITVSGVYFRIKRSSRRTVTMRAASDGVGEILAPRRISLSELERIVRPYAEKIGAECERIRERNEAKERFEVRYGGSLRCLGEMCEVREVSGRKPYFEDGTFYLPRGQNKEALKALAVRAYKDFAREYIVSRLKDIADIMRLRVESVKINSAKTHWGSCSRKNTVNFSWYSIMAKSEALDYIIIHELCHMRHFNHSPAFWREVEKHCPDYKRQKAYLKELWQEISAEAWF